MRCIDDEIPFAIPDSWAWCRLGNVIKLLSGRDLTPSQYNDQKIGVPYITGASNIQDEKIAINRWTESPIVISKFGDLLITCKGTIGTMAFNSIGDIHIARQIMAIAIYKFKINYLKIFLSSYITELQGKAKSMIPGISREDVMNALFPMPPLEEQEKIIEKIANLESLLTEYNKQEREDTSLDAALSDALNKSILHYAIQGKLVTQDPTDEPAAVLLERIREEKKRLVKEKKIKADKNESIIYKGDDNSYYEKIGYTVRCIDDELPFELPENWCWCRLGNISNIYTGNSINAAEKKSKYDGAYDGLSYIATKDVSFEQFIDYDNGVRIPQQYQDSFRIAHKDSVLLCIEGGSAGRKIGITNSDVCFGNKLCCFESYLFSPQYLFFALQTPTFTDNFKNNSSGIIGGVSVNTIKTLLIPLPPLQEQKRIVEKLEKIRAGL